MKNSQWKDIQIEGSVLTDSGNLEGLIGIQELTDYDINTVTKGQKRNNDHLVKAESKSTELDPEPRAKKIKNQKKSKLQTTTKAIIENGFLVECLTESITPDTSDDTKVSINDLTGWNGLGLSSEILQALADLNFLTPTPIQALTLPPAILGRRDILGAAETGSGKTLAFGIPMIHGILQLKAKFDNISNKLSNPLYALILTPTRELTVQVKNHLVAIAKHTDIKIAAILGGMATVKQERILKHCPEIVVATPGRLWELIQERNEHLSKVDEIKFLAIDETDRMVERGHFNELQLLLERLNADESIAKKRQNFVFSATLTLVHDLPKHLALKRKRGAKILNQTPGQKLQHLIQLLGINNPKVVDVTHETGMAKTLTECRISCSIEHKDYYLYYLLKRHPGRTLVFCNSISCVRRLTQLFTILLCNPLPLHANMQQRQRLKNLERFRDNPEAVLVSTDVAARGLDIPDVQHVIHYQVPRSSENYVHRSGRTARAAKEGITILLMEPAESKNYAKLCRTLGKVEDLPLFPIDDAILSAMKKRVNLAREIDSLELQVRRTHAQSSWFEKNAEEMDILLDKDDSDDDDENKRIASNNKKSVSVKKKQLNSLLSQPLFPKGYSSRFPTCNGSLQLPLLNDDESKENAVDIMKKAIENYKSNEKRVKVLKLIKD
uniref:ATP-dependent RNA helicase n=1 Tax=Xenopsylla cheopis TaxID=163159 RepID=A0A6M2DFK1_XENCH